MKALHWMPWLAGAILVCCVTACSGKGRVPENADGNEPVCQEEVYEYGIPVSQYDVREDRIRKGDYFSTLLTRLGVSQADVYRLTSLCEGVFDVSGIRVGYPYHIYYSRDEASRPVFLVYEQDSRSYAVFGLSDSLFVDIREKELEVRREYAEVTINQSLWTDCQQAGVTPLLAIRLADMYAWTIDFFGVQPGDSFRALYELITYRGEILDVGRVLYAEFTHGRQQYPAYWFEEEPGGNEYWNEKGESLRKAFLKAPLNYTRISSGFTYNRRHPITRRVQPHTGVDYAAPAGTPVMSVGDGVVTYRKYSGAGGNMVKIKHNSVYTSAYLHLSRFAKGLKVGDRVRQGEVIGYVGSTGRSTGPHLDFRIWKNGTPINPLKMKSPPSEPVAAGNRARFEAARAEADRAVVDWQARQAFDRALERLAAGKDR